jgi:hypothetical protein
MHGGINPENPKGEVWMKKNILALLLCVLMAAAGCALADAPSAFDSCMASVVEQSEGIKDSLETEELTQLDALQLWAQIFAEVAPLSYQEKSNCFRLTEEEQAALAQRNGEYEKKLKGQDEIEDILARAERDNLVMQDMTLTEFKGLWPELRAYSVQQISTALKKCGIETTRSKKARTARLPYPYTSGL